MTRLLDKVVLITGGGGGLAGGLGTRCHEEGATVVLTDIDEERLQRNVEQAQRAGSTLYGMTIDITDGGAANRLVEQVVEQFGALDCLVNGAGAVRFAPLEEMTEEDWDLTLAVNLKAPFMLIQAAGRIMLPHGTGSIVNITSIAGHVPGEGQLPYSVAKAGSIMLTRAVAQAWASRGIRCNGVSLGLVEWPMAGLALDPALAAVRAASVPLGRNGTAEDMASVVVFLLSDESGYVTGQDIIVDGGVLDATIKRLPRLPQLPGD